MLCLYDIFVTFLFLKIDYDIIKRIYGVKNYGLYNKIKIDLDNDTILTLLETICDFNNLGHDCKLQLYP